MRSAADWNSARDARRLRYVSPPPEAISRKQQQRRNVRNERAPLLLSSLERPDDNQHDDDRRRDSGNLVDHPDGLARKRALTIRELLAIAAEPSLITGQRHHQRQFRRKPRLS